MSLYNNKPLLTGSLDWLSFADDLHAPPPDLFEFELDNSLNGVDQSQLNLLDVLDFSNDSYRFYRDPTALGPPSTITLSSESACDTRSSNSDSLYSFPRSPTYTESVYSTANDLQLGFTNVTLDTQESAVTTAPQHNLPRATHITNDIDINSSTFGELPLQFGSRPSDFDISAVVNPNFTAITPADFYQQPKHSDPVPTPQALDSSVMPISQLRMVFPMPGLGISMNCHNSSTSVANESVGPEDRRRYRCPNCPRAFARAYNLKTHMATHDPHRPKPFTCPHTSCGRSFSRKHDLGRHLISIHHENPQGHKIGTQQAGNRKWCDSCGKGLVRPNEDCDCAS